MPESTVSVLVVAGGPGPEHDVSLASAAAACARLDPGRYAARLVVVGRDGAWRDADGAPLPGGWDGVTRALGGADVVLPLIHGALGEDGTLAGLLETMGVPYVGSGVRASAVGMDKHLTKLVAADLGIPVAPGVVLDLAGPDGDPAAWPATTGHLRYPLFVKPCRQGSSYGVSRVAEPSGLEEAVRRAARYGGQVLVEEGVAGREVDIATLALPGGGVRVSLPLEVVVGAGEFFDTARKYDGSAVFEVPARLGDGDLARLRRMTLGLCARLGCRGVARFDYFVTPGGPVFNEVNTVPGLTEQSQVPRMFAADGLPYPELLAALVDGAARPPAGR